MIILQLKEEITETNRVLFQWRGMNISLQTISSHGDAKYLYVQVADAKFAGYPLDGTWAKWIISKEATESVDAGASTISNGSAGPATSKSTEGR